jgi:cell division protease FtsH
MEKKPFKLGSGKDGRGNHFKNAGFVALIILFGLIIYASLHQQSTLKDVPFSQAISEANSGKIDKITVKGNELSITPKGQNHATERAFKEEGSSIYQQGLQQGKVTLTNQPTNDNNSAWLSLLVGTVLPVLIIGGLLIFMFRSAQGQGNQALSCGKSRARLYGTEKDRINFKDVAGNNEAKQDLEEVVEFLKYPKKFEGVGAKIPKGVLLVGPPGTGKTMLARAVAGEANAPFFSISGSEFVEMFVGVGARRVRDLFNKAKKNAPCIIFIDEIDAVGRRRGSGMGGGHDEREQTLNQILVEMDGFEQGQNVIVLAATNRSDVLDPALLRPGRFDRRVNIDLPDRKDRESILKVHFSEKPVSKDVDLDSLAAKSAGSSGADLANIANEAAILAARHNRKVIENEDVVAAFEKVAIGPERKSKIMS